MALHSPFYWSVATVKSVLDEKGDIDARDQSGFTALHWAFGDKKWDIAQLLLDRDLKNYQGKYALHLAFEGENNMEIVQHMLLKSGADDTCVDIDGRTLLHLAGRTVNETVRTLLLAGADVNSVDKNRQTPLHLAVKKYCVIMLMVGLEQFGDDVDRRRQTLDSVNRTYFAIIETLLQAGADVDSVDKNGQTPLHLAILHSDRNTTLVEALLQAGASPDIQDANGRTPLHNSRTQKAVECLMLKGARLDVKDTFGHTPLDVFLKNRNMTKLIIQFVAAKLHQSQCDIKLDDKNIEEASRYHKLTRFKDECMTEVQKMKNEKIGTLRLFDVFRNSPDPSFTAMTNFEKKVDTAENLNEYPIYMSLLKYKLRGGFRRKALLDEATDLFPRLNETFSISELRRMILAQLTDRDLGNVIKAFQSTNNSC